MATKTRSKGNSQKSGSTASAKRSKSASKSKKRELRDVAVPDIGGFATVTKGEHRNRYGVIEEVVSSDKDGYPEKVVFRTRDDDSARLVVKFDDLEHAEAGRR